MLNRTDTIWWRGGGSEADSRVVQPPYSKLFGNFCLSRARHSAWGPASLCLHPIDESPMCPVGRTQNSLSSTVRTHPKLESTQISITSEMDKQMAVHSFNGITWHVWFLRECVDVWVFVNVTLEWKSMRKCVRLCVLSFPSWKNLNIPLILWETETQEP